MSDSSGEGVRDRASSANTASWYIHSDVPPEPTDQMLQCSRFERHRRFWTCVVGCLCSGRTSPGDANQANHQQRAVIGHLALLTAEYLRASPSLCTWVRGLRMIKRETSEEDEAAFAQCAPSPARWPAEHFALDLGTEPPEGIGAPPPLVDAMRAAAHFAKFALAAYSLKLYALVHPARTCLSAVQCGISNNLAFQRFCGISAQDLLYSQPSARPFKPSWWLAVDHASRTVVITVRGTCAAADFLSDAFARQVHHGGHVLHEGVLASAKWLHTRLLRKLANCALLQRGGYGLVVTGHSLGGAVAAILTWILREDSNYKAQCFTYGAPLVVDWPLAQKMQRFAVGVVHHNDMIPRVGRKSLEDLRERVKEVTQSAETRLRNLEAELEALGLPREPDRLRWALRSGAALPALSRSQSVQFQDAVEDISVLPSLPMFNPGWQLHVQRRGMSSRTAELCPILSKRVLGRMLLTVRTPSPAYMQVVRPCLTMWTDHFPQAYQYVCEALAERLEHKTGPPSTLNPHEALVRLRAYLEGSSGCGDDAC